MGLMAASKLITLVLQLAATVVLAQTLTTVDYGIVGFAQIFISFLNLFSEFGLSSAAVQRDKLTRVLMDTGFTLRLLLGVVALVVAYFIAPIGAQLLGNDAVTDVIKVLSIGFLMNAFSFIPSVRLLRELNYKKYAGAQLVNAVVNSSLTVLLALNGFSYWSIVIANILAIACSVIYLNLAVTERPGFSLENESLHYYQKFGGSLAFSWLLTFMILNIDNLVVGSLLGDEKLGYYALAFTIGVKLCETLGSTINSVLFPTYSKLQNDITSLRKAYLKSNQLITFLTVGGYLILYTVSEDLFVYILGKGTDKWVPAIVAFEIFCIYGVIRTLTEPMNCIAIALGHPRELVKANTLTVILKLVLIYPALKWFGINGVAFVVAIAYASQYIILVAALKKYLKISYSVLVKSLFAPFASLVIVVFVIEVIKINGMLYEASITRFFVLSTMTGFGYLIVYGVLTGGGPYNELLQVFISKHKKI